MLVGLIQNAAVLVALSILYGLLAGMHDRHGVRFQLSAGLLFGFVTLMGMLLPVEYEPGIFYDARSTILTAAGLFGGWIAAAVTILIAGAYRIIEGGVGLWAGLSAILLCPLLGCLVRVMSGNRPDRLRVQHLIMVAFGTHIIVLMAQLLLPWDIALTAIKQLWIPLFFVFGIASVLIFFLLRTEERRVLTARQLRDNKDRFEQVARALGASVWTGPSGGRTLDDISGACEAVGGIPREKLLEDASIWWNAVHPKDRPSAQAAADSVTVLGQTQA
jgi:LytS/YehU family sensor histidine kinase